MNYKQKNNFDSGLLLLISISLLIITIKVFSVPTDVYSIIENHLNTKEPIIKEVPDKLINKNEFVYFKGEIIENSFKISETYEYNPSYPKEFWDGYVSICKLNGGANYTVWSEFEFEKGYKLDGWFIPMSTSFNYNDEYLTLLMPAIRRNTDLFK